MPGSWSYILQSNKVVVRLRNALIYIDMHLAGYIHSRDKI